MEVHISNDLMGQVDDMRTAFSLETLGAISQQGGTNAKQLSDEARVAIHSYADGGEFIDRSASRRKILAM